MRMNGMRLAGLAGLLLLGTGASPKGVRQAERWQWEADIARAFGQWDVAYDRSAKTGVLFPGTPHGRIAAGRAERARELGVNPNRSPASDDPVSWTNEIFDFVTWP